MQKKVFLRKGGGKGSGGRPPYVKYLLWAILGLSIAIVAASYLLHPKSRDTARKTIPEKPTVKKELPKPPEPAPGELPATEKLAGGLAAKPESTPEPPKPEPAPKLEPPPPPTQPTQPQTARPAEPVPKDIFPKSPAAPELIQKAPPAPTAEKKAKKEPARTVRPGPAAPEQKAVKAAPKGGMFAVQVGCYKEKQSAEEVRQRLRKKGYDVELRSSWVAGGATFAYKVVTKPVNKSQAYSLAEQLKAEKISAIVVNSPAAGGVDNAAALKAAMKKPVSKARMKPASATAKSKETATLKVIGPVTSKTIKKQAATAKESKPAAGKNSEHAASKPTATPAKAATEQ